MAEDLFIFDDRGKVVRTIRAAASDFEPTWGTTTPPAWLSTSFGGRTTTGLTVNSTTALRSPAVLAAIRVLSEDIAKLPIRVERVTGSGDETDVHRHELATNHRLHRLLTRQPNGWQTSFEFVEFAVSQLMLTGNFIALKSSSRGRNLQLIPIETVRVTPQVFEGDIWYFVSPNEWQRSQIDNFSAAFHSSDVVHVRGLSRDTVWGMSFVDLCRETISGGQSAELYGNVMFSHAMDVGGVLEHPGQLSEPAQSRLRASWEGRYSGIGNRAKTVVLEEGMKFQKLTMSNDEAQYLDLRKHINDDIARIWRIPPHRLGIMDKASYSNIDELERNYVDNTIVPILTRIEQAFERDLLTATEQQRMHVTFDIDAFVRGRPLDRWTIYEKAIRASVMTPNDVREKEGMPREPGLNYYTVPTNVWVIGPDAKTMVFVQPSQPEQAEGGGNQPANDDAPLVNGADDDADGASREELT